MASGLLIKQKQLLAGDGIAINHGETASTISLAENALDNAVRIYDATVDAETGVITITDGTPVADLAIGDEIRTPDGVYQKIKDNTTTTGPADGSRIEVSGITSPADANGYYTLQSENLWKHETANYWITLFSGRYWMISDKSAPASPGECIFFVTITGPEVVKPWEIDTSWEPMNESVGDPQVENMGALTTVANTIDLFEYASLPVEPENIVQSVNGNKPDASGNVTIETGGGGESSSFGEWIPFEPTGQVVIAHNFNDAFAPGVLQLETGGKLYNIDSRVKFNANDIIIDFTGLELAGEHNARFFGSLASMANIDMPVGAVARYEDYTGSTWSDTSGNSRNLTSSGTVNQEGGAAVFPDSSGKLTCSSGFGLTSTATICMVLSAPAGNSCWLTCELGTIGLYNNTFNFGNTSSSFAASADVGTAMQAGKVVNVIVTVNGSNINYYLNNVKLGLGSTDRWETSVEATLGNVYDRYPFTGGKIFQCVIYDSGLTESDIACCYRYAKHKYAIG